MSIKISADKITDLEVTWFKISDIEPVFEKGYPSYKAVNDKPKEK